MRPAPARRRWCGSSAFAPRPAGVGGVFRLSRRAPPAHPLGELLVALALLRLHRFVDEPLAALARLGPPPPLHHLAGEPVDRDELAVLVLLALDRQHPPLV